MGIWNIYIKPLNLTEQEAKEASLASADISIRSKIISASWVRIGANGPRDWRMIVLVNTNIIIKEY